MWDEYFRFLQMLMFMAIFMRIANELKPPPKAKAVSMLPETRPVRETAKPSAIISQQKAWAEKAVKRYAEAQQKKWRRWNHAMFEPVK